MCLVTSCVSRKQNGPSWSMYYICKARRFMNDLCAQLFNLYQITYMYAPYFEESLVLKLAYHLRDGISRSFHGDLHGNYSGFLRVYRVFPGFSELRDSNCLSKVGQFQFEDGVLSCLLPTRSSQLESNWLCKFCEVPKRNLLSARFL